MAKSRQAKAAKIAMAPRHYPDLHEHLERLEREGLLIRVKEPVCKDREMHPLVRWQFRGGIKEHERKAFLFEKPTDANCGKNLASLNSNRRAPGTGIRSGIGTKSLMKSQAGHRRPVLENERKNSPATTTDTGVRTQYFVLRGQKEHRSTAGSEPKLTGSILQPM